MAQRGVTRQVAECAEGMGCGRQGSRTAAQPEAPLGTAFSSTACLPAYWMARHTRPPCLALPCPFLQEDQRELAKTIRVSGSILLSTVSNFLDFFKIEAGKQLDIVRSPLDLRDLVTDVHCIIEAMVGREVRRARGEA